VQTVEISRADKTVSVDGVDVAKGQVIGLLDDRLVAGGDDLTDITIKTLNLADLAGAELITIFFGHDASRKDAEQVAKIIAREYPKIAIEVYDGGQPHYGFVISVE
jgi:dihydroxyacetone kinase-like predicted kinase